MVRNIFCIILIYLHAHALSHYIINNYFKFKTLTNYGL